jgi:hypothetical protein
METGFESTISMLTPYRLHMAMEYRSLLSLNALDGLFGFSKDTLESGNFSGTLFRFPFREEKTALSDNVYNKDKILDLFKAFQG